MANLILPYRFVPGQLALASEMNANFQAIENWAGGNLGTTNITILEARPGGGSILEFNQTANFPVIDVSNSGADSAIKIVQATPLQSGKAVIDVEDNNNHTAPDTVHLRLKLNGLTNIPAIEVTHDVQNTLTVRRTGITTDVGITTLGALTAASLNLTQPLTLLADPTTSTALKIKGRSSDNQSQIVLKSNDDATTYAEITSKTTGLEVNLPDIADSLTVTVNGVTKAAIDNTGIDGQYLKNLSVSTSKIDNGAVTLAKQGPSNLVSVNLANAGPSPGVASLGTVNITTNGSSSILLVNLIGTTTGSYLSTSGPGFAGYVRIQVTGPSGYDQSYYIGAAADASGGCATFVSGTVGTYTVNLLYTAPVSGACVDMRMLVTEIR